MSLRLRLVFLKSSAMMNMNDIDFFFIHQFLKSKKINLINMLIRFNIFFFLLFFSLAFTYYIYNSFD